MVDLHLRLPPQVLRQLEETLARFADPQNLEARCDPALVEEDPEMREIWRNALREQLMQDVHWLSRHLGLWKGSRGRQRVPEDEAEGIIRACSAIRVRVRELALSRLSDELLETGDFNPQELTEEETVALQGYILLAGLQAHVVEALDPECAEEP